MPYYIANMGCQLSKGGMQNPINFCPKINILPTSWIENSVKLAKIGHRCFRRSCKKVLITKNVLILFNEKN